MKKKYNSVNVGDLVPIYYTSTPMGRSWFINKTGIVTSVTGYKSTVLMDDGTLETWSISDLKKMSAHKWRDSQ